MVKRWLLGLLVVMAGAGLWVTLRPDDGRAVSRRAEILATLPEAEREALAALCLQAGLRPEDLRPSGPGGVAQRAPALAIRDGHVVALGIQHSPLADLAPLEKLPALEILWLPDNRISRLPELTDSRLTQLVLSGNRLTSLHGFDAATNLVHLDLSRNALTSLTGFPPALGLLDLNLSANRLTSLSGLASLPRLEKLNLGDNRLSRLQGLQPQIELRQLDLSHNRLATLAGMPALPQLRALNLADNQLSALEDLSFLQHLSSLNLDRNRLSALDALNKLPELQQFSARDNRIAAWPPALSKRWGPRPEGLSGNPLAAKAKGGR